MIKEGKFGVHEAVCMTTITISAKLFFTSPAFLTNFVGTAGWQMTLISNLSSIIAFTFIYLLLKRFPGIDIIEIFHSTLGGFLGSIFSLVFSASFILGAGTLLREFIDVIKVYVYRDTPSGILMALFVFTVIIISILGLETIVRVSKLCAYIMLSMLILLLLLAFKNYELTNMFPIFGYGIDKTIIHGLRRSSAYDEVLMLAVFAGSLQGIQYVKKAGYITLVLSGLIIASGLFCFSLAFPVQTTQELVAPIYVLARGIKHGAFLQRLDPLFLFLWNFASFIAVTALFYCSVSSYCKTFKISDTKPVIFPMSLLLFSIAMLPKDFPRVIEGNVQISREYGWVVFYILPFIAFIVAIIRKKKVEIQKNV